MTDYNLAAMKYCVTDGNPNKDFWNLLKTESIISITAPVNAMDSVVIKANKTCIVPGLCVFFYLREQIGPTYVNRIHRGFIGILPFDNTHANLYIITGAGYMNYPGYTVTYPYTEDIKTYTGYSIGSINYYDLNTFEWFTNSRLSIDNNIKELSENKTIKVWNSNVYTNEDSDLFTTMQKCSAYNESPVLEDESTISELLVRVPASWDTSKNSLYNPNYDYHNIYSFAFDDDTEDEDNRGKNLQYRQTSPFICTPTVITRMVRKGYEAFALNAWGITASVCIDYYRRDSDYTDFYNNPPALMIMLSYGAGFSINDSASSLSVTLDLYGYGSSTINIPITGNTVPNSPYREESDSTQYSKYSHEESYLGKIYYNGYNGANVWIDITEFGFVIDPSVNITSALRNYATVVSISQVNPDYEIMEEQHPDIGSTLAYRNMERKFCVCGATDYTFLNLSSREDYDSNFPEGFLMFFPTMGKPVSLIDEITVDSAVVYYQNNDITGDYRDSTGLGTASLLEYNTAGVDTTRYVLETSGWAERKVNYVYVVAPRLGIPDKDTFITAGSDLPADKNPEWESSPYLKIDLLSGGDIVSSFETSTRSTTDNYWIATKTAGNFNYNPITGTQGATVTYKQVFTAPGMIASFNDDADYALSSFYPVPPTAGSPNPTTIVFHTGSPSEQYAAPYYDNGGRIYFDVQAGYWVVRREGLPDVIPSKVSYTFFSGCSSISISLYEVWRTKYRSCASYTLYYKL